MSYTKTLSDARNDIGLQRVARVCTDTDEFTYLVNSATERMLQAGNWFGTEQLARICLYNGCISWPRYVGTVLGVRMCNQSVDIKNHWYSIVGPAFNCGIQGYGDGWWGQFGFSGFNGRSYPVVGDTGTTPLFSEITNSTGSYIRLYAVKREDWGKTVQLFGHDSNNQPLQEKDADGNWVMGITITLADPHVQTTIKIPPGGIRSVLKQETQGNVLMYEVDPDDATNIRQLALYEPGETNPSYRRSRFSGLCVDSSGCKDSDDVPIKAVDALFKLAYIPVKNANDFLLIDDFTALKFLIQCITLEEGGETGRAQDYELKAIRQLNLRDRDKMPYNQNPVVVSPLQRTLVNPI